MSDVFDDIVRAGDTAPDDSPVSARRGAREDRDRRRRQRRRRSTIALVLSLGILGAGTYVVIQYVVPMFASFGASPEDDAADYPGPGSGPVDVVIPPGSTGTAMAQILVEQDVVQSARAFTMAFAANPSASGIQPGTYRLLEQMRAADAVTALLNPANRVQTKVTIPEGLRLVQVLEKLSSVTTIPVADFEAAMADQAATGLPAEAGGSYEGWLFPATYTFEPDTDATAMIATMIAQTIALLDERGVPAPDRQRVLTMASLVESEARTPEDRAKVARAIQNRLDSDMKLDIDASVAYGAGKNGTELTQEDLDTETPYNLYLRTGLPPTPIAAPSAVSLDAVLAPAEGPWLFWVTVNLDTGETKFATTYPEHQTNVAELRAWQAANPDTDG